MTAPVLDGLAQYGVGDAEILKLRAEGRPVVVLAQIFQHSPAVLITKRESGISSPYELIGKKIMLPEEGLDSAAVRAMILETLGGMDRVVVIPHTGDDADLVNGKADAISGYLSTGPFRLKKTGLAVNIIDPRSYGIDFYGDNLFTTEKEIREHPERVGKMIRATLRGWVYALANKDEIIDLIRRDYNPVLDEEKLRFEANMVDRMILPDLVPIGDINPRRYERIAETYHRLGLSQSAAVPDGFIYTVTPERAVLLTAEERAWLANHPVITLGGGNFVPLDSGDDSGRAEGIGPDYARLIGRMLGIQFKFVSGDWAKIQEMARQHQIDGIRLLLENEEREEYLQFTRPYTTLQHAILTQKSSPDIRSLSDLAHKRVGTMNAVYAHTYMQNHYPEIELVPFPSVEENLKALVSGQLDAAVASLAVAGSIMDRMFITNLKVTALPGELSTDLHMGIRKDWPEFVSILDKAIAAIPRETHLEIKSRWISRQYQVDTQHVELTAVEKAWLAENHTVRVRTADWPPYLIVKENEPPQGISIEYLNLIGKRTGIKFNYEATKGAFCRIPRKHEATQGSRPDPGHRANFRARAIPFLLREIYLFPVCHLRPNAGCPDLGYR